MGYLRIVEETTKKRITPLRPPSESEALAGQQQLTMETLIEIVQANDLGDYRILANQLLEEYHAVDLVTAAIKSMTREPDDTPVTITEERLYQ
ncbi:DEAD-box ATP-dependent RNA helicase CshA OS=Ureibacillus acetophenoni OX=614649 GN=cshA PE=3 SV=1 [Ureibacillus acetophenoni]